ncbi:3-deoxy-D-manno-octulosonic acid transferase [Glaciecola sp. MH2013]|uniref:3-deoxy-D-manno-octulosonic acid transferase n=1 Tax=Glaciecola sp. MH2013 TaxID=2785524 RepID=UPI00189F04A7|nr:3-deoxy-D-manno-octulosonic acid transferase [Glaciecola sp. MH2013]MBF7073733.1 3-deoxy-D-manno-octulosonic acid transferase [Glaciecola sp. MH2013]
MNTIKPYQSKWHHHIWRWLYSFIILLLLPLALLKLLSKSDSTAGKSNQNRERFGFIGKKKQGGILVHCVSMGEVNAARNVIEQLLLKYPELAVTITTSSTTGAKHARAIFKDRVQHCYLAIDLPICMSLFFSKLQPSMVIVTEVEIWPNMLEHCYRRKIPTLLINARMSANSVKNYQGLAWLMRPSLRKFTKICAQSSKDFERFLSLGVYKPNLLLSNNMKFDLQIDANDGVLAKRITDTLDLASREVFVAGSTHEGEELRCLEVFSALKKLKPNMLLILVPRHPHRFDKVAQLCLASGFSTLRSSTLAIKKSESSTKAAVCPDILVVDEMGLLKACFQLASIAFIGGSFVDKGGHNALESALYGVPTVMGPSVYNNPVICDALARSGGLCIIESQKSFTDTLLRWLQDDKLRAELAIALQAVLKNNAGAVQVTVDCIGQFIVEN